MNLKSVMDEIGEELDTIDGLRVYDFPSDKVATPAAVVTLPETITYDETYGRGMDRIDLAVVVMVGRVSDRAARDNLAAYAAGSGSSSIKAVLEGGSYDSFDSVRVVRAEFDVVRVSGEETLAAMFELDIAGQGA